MDETPQYPWMLWIDGVGGIWLSFSDEVILGSGGHAAANYIPFMGDLLPEHARIRRDSDWYVLAPSGPVRLNRKPVHTPQVLAEGDEVQLGETVRLRFRCPHPLSHSLRIEPFGGSTTWPRSHAVVLMDRWCMLGPRGCAHVVVPMWTAEVVLLRFPNGLRLRFPRKFAVNGQVWAEDRPLNPPCRVEGPGFSFFAEPLV
ncbi:MAG: hypothetical protein NZ899_03345 [Thermoguttaceae bacterium]|nr:hypothetical protein [Thermoguttaceae bacterium]MDW8078849.1 FHA domain-containing protein [Thermoguttaceae bacterium]